LVNSESREDQVLAKEIVDLWEISRFGIAPSSVSAAY